MENHNYPLFFHPQQFINSINNNNNTSTILENMYGNGTTSTPNHQEYMKNEEDVTSYKESIVMEPENSNNSNEKDDNKKVKGDKKVRRQRFAFQTRSQVDILDDGYRWRKYGQKAVKNNNFPRSYYRCTHQGCNVKKQVQRLSKDEGVVVTTYEGVHTHPIQKSNDNFEHILNQMQIYSAF